MNDLDERQLIQLCTKGDLNAFDLLVKRYETKIFLVAYRLTGNRQEGEDLAQETFIRAWKALPRFRGEASLNTWLITIVTNLWRDRQRKQKLPVDSLDEPLVFADNEISQQIPDQSPGPEAIYEDKETLNQLGAIIQSLKPGFRLVLILRDIHGYSYEEVSEITNLPIGTVKSRINRARKYLKDKLLEQKEQYASRSRLNQHKELLQKGGEA